jgi:hypothetical protein
LVDELRDGETVEDAAASKAYKSKRPALNFAHMGIPIGSELVSLVQDGIKVTVVGERKVRFNGQEMFLTAATKLVLDTTNEVAPSPYWSFNGEILKNIYDATYLQEE